MPTSPKKIIFCPNLDGSCVASAIAHALIYITHKVLINNDDTLIQHSKSIIALAQIMNDHEPVANLKTACQLILGDTKESFTDKERRIMLAIKDHAQTSLRLFTKIAENTLVALEVCGIEFDDDWLIHACEIDKSKAAAYQALAEHIANTHRQNLEKTEPKSLDYQQFGLTRIAVLDILLSYFKSPGGWLPDDSIKELVTLYGGDPKTQSFLSENITIRGGDSPGFKGLDPRHTYVAMPDDPISTAMRAMGADIEKPEGEEDQARAVTLLSSLAHAACDNIEKHSTTIMIILAILLIIMLKLLSAFIRSTETIGINDTIADLPLMKMRGTSTCGF